MPAARDERPDLRSHVAIALVSGAILLYEVCITRLLSVVLWYHFAFLSLSIAMLGLGAPGVWFALRKVRQDRLPALLLTSAVAVPASIAAIVTIGRPLAGAGLGGTHPVFVCFVALAILVPMLALGSSVCLLLLGAPGERIGRMYGADLLGATLGALLVVPLLYSLPSPLLLASLGGLPLVALWVVRRGLERAATVVAVLWLGSLLWGAPYQVAFTKSYVEETAPLFEHWSPTARVTVLERPVSGGRADKAWGWGLGSRFQQRPAEQRWIDQDGSAGTPIERYRGDDRDIQHLAFDVTGVGYQLEWPARVCIIGPGGGRDILTARLFGATTIDAIELNPGVYLAMTTAMAEFSGDVYRLPGVEVTVAEGRSFLTRHQASYDFIQIALVDSWTATAAGAYALSENYLYTAEAMRLYWRRLAEGGTLSVSRWMLGNAAMETPRLALLVEATLAELGVAEPERHIAVLGASGVATVLVSRRPFDRARIEALDRIVAERGFQRHWPPHPATQANSLTALVLTRGPAELEAYGFNLEPPRDDRPFFFQMASVFRTPDVGEQAELNINDRSVLVLRWLLVALGALALVLFFAPFALARERTQGARLGAGAGYFALIGLGFMLAELPWIQRFILYLGHPSYATTAVLSALLCGAGLGAMLAPRLGLWRGRRYALVLPAVVALASSLAAPLCSATLGSPLALRVLWTVAILTPTGLVMGFAFPLGMLAFGDDNKAWNWAVNGAFGVLGSVSSLVLAMALGFDGVSTIAVCAYLGAALLLRHGKQKRG